MRNVVSLHPATFGNGLPVGEWVGANLTAASSNIRCLVKWSGSGPIHPAITPDAVKLPDTTAK